MWAVGDALDNVMAESSSGTRQLELVNRRHWETNAGSAPTAFGWIEALHYPCRCHYSIASLSLVEFESRHADAGLRQDHHSRPVRRTSGSPTEQH